MTVRFLLISDVNAMADLTAQLGYPTTAEQVSRRMEHLLNKTDEAVLVAESDDGLPVGWLHIRALSSLHIDPLGEICGMVVDRHYRSQGIGARLVKAAEQWTVVHGSRKMRVRSNAVRKDAHRFYERAGFTLTKTSLTFEKYL